MNQSHCLEAKYLHLQQQSHSLLEEANLCRTLTTTKSKGALKWTDRVELIFLNYRHSTLTSDLKSFFTRSSNFNFSKTTKTIQGATPSKMLWMWLVKLSPASTPLALRSNRGGSSRVGWEPATHPYDNSKHDYFYDN